MNRQFCIDTLAALTGIVAVLAVSKVKVGRLLPRPKPIMSISALSKFSAVALDIVSA